MTQIDLSKLEPTERKALLSQFEASEMEQELEDRASNNYQARLEASKEYKKGVKNDKIYNH